MHITLRKPETELKYQEWLKQPKEHECCFCRESIYKDERKKTAIFTEWRYWYLMSNEFPYDKVFNRHDLLFCKRHVDWNDLTYKEIEEYKRILIELKPEYHQLLENIGDRISQRNHYHIHLATFL